MQHKARNLLKRVGKMEVSQNDGEDFERANLLLAKFYIDKVSGAATVHLTVFYFHLVNMCAGEERHRAGAVQEDAGAEQELLAGLGDPGADLREGVQVRPGLRRLREGAVWRRHALSAGSSPLIRT